MKLKMTTRILSVSILTSICMITGCAGNTTAEFPGSVDYSVYEAYGLAYDKKTDCYIYNGSIVRFFNDPAAGASFTNFFTGTVDIEAKRDADNKLIGIEECSQEVYDLHTRKHQRFQSTFIGTEPDAAMEDGTGKSNGELLKDYEEYGVSFDSQDGCWYYDGDKIRILVDSERTFVYYTDKKGVCLAVSRDGNHNITEVKNISESDAGLLLQANKPNAGTDS